MYIKFDGVQYRVYFEEAGTGPIPMVLQHTGGNLRQSARLLGITRGSLRNKLRELGITIARTVEGGEDSD